MGVDARLRLCGACIVLAGIVGFLAARQHVASSQFRSVDWYEVCVAVVVLLAAGLGLSQRPSVPGVAMFLLAATAAWLLLHWATAPDIEQDYVFVNYFGVTPFIAFFGVLASLFAPRPDPNDPSPFD